jgi:hypothetical protein
MYPLGFPGEPDTYEADGDNDRRSVSDLILRYVLVRHFRAPV